METGKSNQQPSDNQQHSEEPLKEQTENPAAEQATKKSRLIIIDKTAENEGRISFFFVPRMKTE